MDRLIGRGILDLKLERKRGRRREWDDGRSLDLKAQVRHWLLRSRRPLSIAGPRRIAISMSRPRPLPRALSSFYESGRRAYSIHRWVQYSTRHARAHEHNRRG